MEDLAHVGLEDISAEVTLANSGPKFAGAYSDVYIGKFRNKTVAVKVPKLVGRKSLATMRGKLRREWEVWAALKHPNIVPCYGYAEDGEQFGPFGALISPWYVHGDAGQFLKAHGEQMDITARSTLWLGVISGVHYLHTHSPVIVHGDLKPGNILIDDSLTPRICDFGLARVLGEVASELTTRSAHTGTERYLAHELVASDDMCSPTTFSDVHALGCIGFEFIYLQLPYANRTNNARGRIFLDILKKEPPAPRPDSLPESFILLWETFDTCWRLNPVERTNTENLIASHRRWHESIGRDVPTRDLSNVGKRTFGVDLEEQMSRDCVEVPKVVVKCCEAVELYGIQSEGIYRLSGSQNWIQKLKEMMDRDIDSVDLNSDEWMIDINVVACVLKLWLRELPRPLMTKELEAGFLEAANIENHRLRRIRLHERVNDLPHANYATLKYLLGHLYKVAEHQKDNRMSVHDLARIFSPILFGRVKAIEGLLAHYTGIFVED